MQIWGLSEKSNQITAHAVFNVFTFLVFFGFTTRTKAAQNGEGSPSR